MSSIENRRELEDGMAEKFENINKAEEANTGQQEDGASKEKGREREGGTVEKDGAKKEEGRATDVGTVETDGAKKEEGRATEKGTVETDLANKEEGRATEWDTVEKDGAKKEEGRATEEGTVDKYGAKKEEGRATEEGTVEKDGTKKEEGKATEEGTMDKDVAKTEEGRATEEGTVEKDGAKKEKKRTTEEGTVEKDGAKKEQGRATEECTMEKDGVKKEERRATEGGTMENDGAKKGEGRATEEGTVEKNGAKKKKERTTEDGTVEKDGAKMYWPMTEEWRATEGDTVEKYGVKKEEGRAAEGGTVEKDGAKKEKGRTTEEGTVEKDGAKTEEGRATEEGSMEKDGDNKEEGRATDGGTVEKDGTKKEEGRATEEGTEEKENPPVTAKDIQASMDKAMAEMEGYVVTIQEIPLLDEEENVYVKVRNCFFRMTISYFATVYAPLGEIIAFREELSKVMVEIGSLLAVCNGQQEEGASKEKGRETEGGTVDIQAFKDEAMAKLEADVVTIQEIPLLDEEGNVDFKVMNCIFRMSESYYAAKKAPLEEVIEFRKELSKVMVESGSLSAVCNIVIQIYPDGWANEENTTNLSRWDLLSIMILLLNYSNASELLAEHIANFDGFLEMIKQIIVDSTVPHLSDKHPVNRSKLTKCCLCLVENISMVQTNIGHLRRLDFAEILNPYLASPDEMIRFTVTASLAGIINEEESEIIIANKDHIRLHMDVLRKSLTDAKRRNRGWSCKECGRTIWHLAWNDANKKQLVEQAALKLLMELEEMGNDDENADINKAEDANTGQQEDGASKKNGRETEGGTVEKDASRKEEGRATEEGTVEKDGTKKEKGIATEEGTVEKDGSKKEEGRATKGGTVEKDGAKNEERRATEWGTVEKDGAKKEEGRATEEGTLEKDGAKKEEGRATEKGTVENDGAKKEERRATEDGTVEKDGAKNEEGRATEGGTVEKDGVKKEKGRTTEEGTVEKDEANKEEGRATEEGTVEKDGAKKEEGRATEGGTVEKDGTKKEEGRATQEGTEEKEDLPVTANDIQACKDEAMATMEADVVTIQEIPLLDEEGNVDVKVMRCIRRMSESFFAMEKAPLEEVIEFRKELSEVMVESGSLSAVCKLVIQIYPGGWANEENTTNMSRWNPLKNILLLLMNYSYASELLAEHIANVDGFLEIIKQIIVDSTVPHLSDKHPVNRAKLTKCCLCLVENISMVENNIGHLRGFDFVEILKPYLASQHEMIRFTVMASLAGIINEEESEIINTNKDHVRLHMDVLRKSLTEAKRRNGGWSCKECGLTIRQLARNDANKKLLVQLQALKVLDELADDDIADINKAEDANTEETEEPPLTAKDIQAVKDEEMAKMEADVVTIQEIPLLDEEGNVDVNVRNCIRRMITSYYAANKAPLEEVIEFRKELSKVMVESGSLSAVCNIVIQIYPDRWANEENTTNMSRWNLLENVILLLLNYSDASELLAVHIANVAGFLEMIKQIIVDFTVPHLSDVQPVNREKLTKWCLGLVMNISMVENNIGHLRRLDFVEILKPYLASPVEMIRLSVMASLAGIINEEESEIINTNKDHVRLLMDVLRKGLTDPERRNRNLSCKECGSIIRQLARNDANKKLLVELEALKLLVELAETGNDDEKAEAVQAIWALTFDEDNRKHIINDDYLGRGVVNILRSLKTSDDCRISKACHAALWTLRDDLATSPNADYKETGERLLEMKCDSDMRSSKKKRKEKPSATDDDVQHVMLSYQWSDQAILKKIRDELKKHGMKVWMDIDQTGGSTLQAMTDAVEKAGAVLICMSQKYKNSPNCRAEAEYSFQQRKNTIPLKMERGYMPDGWLGIIAGTKLFFDFSGNNQFEPEMDGLLQELRRVMQPSDQHKEEVITPVTVEQSHASLPHLDTTDGPPPVSHPVAMGTSSSSSILVVVVVVL